MYHRIHRITIGPVSAITINRRLNEGLVKLTSHSFIVWANLKSQKASTLSTKLLKAKYLVKYLYRSRKYSIYPVIKIDSCRQVE